MKKLLFLLFFICLNLLGKSKDKSVKKPVRDIDVVTVGDIRANCAADVETCDLFDAGEE